MKFAIKFQDKIMMNGGKSSLVWIFRVPFCVLSLINVLGDREGDRISLQVRRVQQRIENLEVVQICSAKSSTYFSCYFPLCVKATRNIGIGEELFVSYVSEYI